MNKAMEDKAGAPSRRELQHAAVAELGRMALAGCSFDRLCEQAVNELSACLNLRFIKILELSSDKAFLTVKFGRGWSVGIVGTARVPNNERSQAGFTLQTADTVVVYDFSKEIRFAPPQLLSEHSIKCGASVVIGPLADPWGVLGVHESELGRCSFDQYDIAFLSSVANLLWLYVRNARAVRASEQERVALRSFADAMPIFLAVLDSNERYEYVNKAYNSLGNPSAIIGKRVEELAGPDTYSAARPYLQRAFAGEAVRFETELNVGDAGKRDVLVTYAPRRRAHGGIDGVYAAILDVSDQKQRQREAVERSRQFQAIADSIPYGIWVCNSLGELVYVSDSFLELVGMSFDEARDFGWIASLLPEEAETTRADWEACIEARDNWEREHIIVGRDGRHYSILAIARPVFDDDGELLSYVGLNLDITERKRREETLGLLARELDHRVKNVFALVLTIVRMTSRKAQSVEDFRSGIEGRIRSLASAHELVGDHDWQDMSLKRLVSEELAPYEGDRVHLDGPELGLSVECVQPLALCIHELATNAAKYGALGTENGRLEVTWHQRDGNLVLDWKEWGLEGLEPPWEEGFGSTVLSKVIALQLDAEVRVDYLATGVQVGITLPDACVTLRPGQE